MNFKENSKAIYLQIADKIMDDVVTGRYVADERIPSVRDYAANVEVNSNTVMRSYEYLAQEGVIYNKRGLGYFISQQAKDVIIGIRKEAFYKEEMDYFFSRLKTLGISASELAEMYEKYNNRSSADGE